MLRLPLYKREFSSHLDLNRALPFLYAIARNPTQSAIITTTTDMSSDEAYASFLEKANQPTGNTSSTSRSKAEKQQDLKSQSSDIPQVLRSLDATFTSDSDEPFEPFTVEYSGSSLPGAEEFAQVIKEGNRMEELGMEDFDPRSEYKDVVEAVREAAGGQSQVKCFRAEGGKSTQVFYYAVALESAAGRLVGVRAVSVES